MKLRAGIFGTMMWGGAAGAVVVGLVWGATCRRGVGWTFRNGCWVEAGWGQVALSRFDDGFPVPVYGASYSEMCDTSGAWWYGEYRATMLWRVQSGAWVPLAACAAIAGAGWGLRRRDRRPAGAGRCSRCGYELVGLCPGATCPECGT